jgi:SNF2 family DNA or RNA helicase
VGFILKSAIDDLVHKPRDDWRWMKALTHADMDEALAQLRPSPNLYKGINLHQKVGFWLGAKFEGFSYWYDMGTGKTLIMLELLKYLHKRGKLRRALVFTLSDTGFGAWERQISRYKIGLPIIALEGSSEQKWETLDRFGDGIVLVSYPGAVAMCSSLVRKRKKDYVWNEMVLRKDLMKRLAQRIDVMVMDESTRVGNHQSLSHRLCKFIGRRAHSRYALAGRPFGRDPTLLWGQQKIIDGGASLGETLGLFRKAFFTEEENTWSKNKYSKTFTYLKSKNDDLSRMMQHRSLTYEDHECGDLPEFNAMIEPVRMSDDGGEYYEHAVEALSKSGGNFVETMNAFIRMRQITSGFIGYKDDDTGERCKLAFDRNPKLEKLIEKLGELPEGRKAVVFYEFTWSGKHILAEIFKARLGSAVWLWSGTKDRRRELYKFMNDDDYRICVLQNKLGAFSLDGLQEVANYVFIYESPVSVIERKQLEKRVNRPGQEWRVHQYDLVVPGSVDERILQFHKEGIDLMKAIRKDPGLLLMETTHSGE